MKTQTAKKIRSSDKVNRNRTFNTYKWLDMKLSDSDKKELNLAREEMGLPPVEERKKRPCLRCGVEFMTIKSIRLCPKCKPTVVIADDFVY